MVVSPSRKGLKKSQTDSLCSTFVGESVNGLTALTADLENGLPAEVADPRHAVAEEGVDRPDLPREPHLLGRDEGGKEERKECSLKSR